MFRKRAARALAVLLGVSMSVGTVAMPALAAESSEDALHGATVVIINDGTTGETAQESEESSSSQSSSGATTGVTAGSASTAESITKPYVSLGADLTSEQRATVLRLLGVTEEDLKKDTVVTVTNSEEHKVLGDYLSSSVIGTKSLSSALVMGAEKGSGISVTTYNIDYCTESMYQNALVTAGVKDANVVVAGPFTISGTAALIGVMKAYSEMTGEELNSDNTDTAAQELTTTSQVAADTGDQEKTEQLISAVKEQVVADKVTDEDDIGSLVDQASDQLGLELSDKDRTLIINLMVKIGSLDINVNTLRDQAGKIYDQLKNSGLDISISKEQATGILQKIFSWLGNFFTGIANFFGGGSSAESGTAGTTN